MQVLVKVQWVFKRFRVQYVSKMEIRPFEDSKIKKIDRKWRVFIREVKAGVERV